LDVDIQTKLLTFFGNIQMELTEKLKNLRSRHQDITDEVLAMAEDAESFDDEKQSKYDELIAEAEGVEKQIVNVEAAIRRKNLSAEKVEDKVSEPVVRDQIDMTPALPREKTAPKIPASVRRVNRMKAFKNDLMAYQFGQWVRACVGVASAKEFCAEHGFPVSLHSEGVNTAGGYLVPIQFSNEIIKLVDEYGVFRRYSRIRPMTTDTLLVPRRSGGLTAYAIGEGVDITESTKSWDQVSLVARDWGVLARMTNNLSEDAIISVADDLAWEIAYALAYAEDQCGFIGDGTSTYHGIVGVSPALKTAAGTPTTTSAGGVIVGAGNAMSELTLANHNDVVGKCPAYARAGARWYCSSYYFSSVMQKLMYAAGGNTVGNIAGGSGMQFLGYEVVTTEVLPASDANSQIVCLFGRLDMATSFGDRQMLRLAFSDSATIGSVNVFERNEMAVRGIERFDINAHDVGTTSVAGPIVGLQTLNT
jgi:HK97 family phage major capsid protein